MEQSRKKKNVQLKQINKTYIFHFQRKILEFGLLLCLLVFLFTVTFFVWKHHIIDILLPVDDVKKLIYTEVIKICGDTQVLVVIQIQWTHSLLDILW